MSEPIVHHFRACVLRLWPEQMYAETIFRDGAVAGATRDCEVGQRAYAADLGYSDCWRAMVEHEAAHSLVSERLGHPYSPTLWAVAHQYAPGTAPYDAQLAEEAIVLQLQRFLRRGVVGWALRHPDVRPHYSRWARDLDALSRRLLTRTDEAAA